MIKNLTILGIGVLIGYLLFNKSKNLNEGQLKVGDKGKDIEGMQKSFERIANLKFDEYGQYDSDTQAAVLYLMQGTKALKDQNGTLKKDFVNDLAKMYYNSLNILQ